MKRHLYDAEAYKYYKDSSYIEVDKSLDLADYMIPKSSEDGEESSTKTTYDLQSFIIHDGEINTLTSKMPQLFVLL